MLKIANQEVHYYLLIMCVIHHREEIASHVVPLLMAFTIYIYIRHHSKAERLNNKHKAQSLRELLKDTQLNLKHD